MQEVHFWIALHFKVTHYVKITAIIFIRQNK